MIQGGASFFLFLLFSHYAPVREREVFARFPIPTFLSELKPTLDTVITFHFNNPSLSAVVIIFDTRISRQT